MHVQVEQDAMYQPVIGLDSLHATSNVTDQRCVNFSARRGVVVRTTIFLRKDTLKATWESLDQHTQNQFNHVLIDVKFFSDIIYVRTYCSTDIVSDHYLVAAWMCSKLSTLHNTRQSRIAIKHRSTTGRGICTRISAAVRSSKLPTEEQRCNSRAWLEEHPNRHRRHCCSVPRYNANS